MIKKISIFLRYISAKFGVNKIFIESFPDAEISSIKLMTILIDEAKKLNIENEINLGFAGYENLNYNGFSKNIKIFIEKYRLMIMPIKFFQVKV